MYNVMS